MTYVRCQLLVMDRTISAHDRDTIAVIWRHYHWMVSTFSTLHASSPDQCAQCCSLTSARMSSKSSARGPATKPEGGALPSTATGAAPTSYPSTATSSALQPTSPSRETAISSSP